MLRRIIYFLLVAIFLGGLGTVVALWAFEWKPKMVAQMIMSAPPPVQTVSAEPAREETWQPQIVAVGSLIAVNGIEVSPEVGGIIKEIYFDSGQTMKKGDKLVQLDTATNEADLRNLNVQLENAQRELDRRQKIFQKGFAAKSELETATMARDRLVAEIDRTKAEIAQKSVYAPWDGRLGLRNIAVGKYIAPGQTLVWMQSVDPIYADFTISEADFARLKPGLVVNAKFSAYPGEIFRGELFTTDAKVAPDSRMVTVRAKIGNPDGRLVPGMYANIGVDAGTPETVVTVPQNAITYSLYGDSVFVATPPKDQNGSTADVLVIERRFVKAGQVRAGRAQVVDGIKAGERVVVAGQNKIDQGSKVKIDNSIALNAPADRMSQ